MIKTLFRYIKSFFTKKNLGVALPNATAIFETSLASPITSSATSMTLSANSVRGGGSVSGYTCFTIDEGSSQAEFVCGTVSGTSVTSLTRGISPADGVTENTDLQFSHRRGANVKITDFPLIQLIKSQNNGDATFENPLKYASGVAPLTDDDLADKEYVDNTATGAAITRASTVIPGNAGETVAEGDLVYFDETDNEWKLVDADTATTVNAVKLGIAQGAGTNGNNISGGVLTEGTDTKNTGLTEGQLYYASNTAGGIGTSAGTIERVIGFGDASGNLVFDPNYKYVPTDDEKDAMAGGGDLGTPSADNKFLTEDTRVIQDRFGGDGSDGALAVTTGTTDIDLGGERVVVKNYTSISITGDGKVTFSNPHASGTTIILRSTGDVTLTSSEAPMLDASGIGASGGAGLASGTGTRSGNVGTDGVSLSFQKGTGGGAGSGNSGNGDGGSAFQDNDDSFSYLGSSWLLKYFKSFIGAGGGSAGGSSASTYTTGDGGRGGGALVIECAGAWNFTTSNGISVAGENGGTPTGGTGQTGGSGGGAGGFFWGLYKTLTANSGTVNVSGGVGGNNGSADPAGGSAGGGASLINVGTAGNGTKGGDGGAGLSGVTSIA